jgi:hypothetical protein
LAWGGEIALHKDGVGGEQREPLRGAERTLTAAGGADLGARVGEPEERQGAQAVTGRGHWTVLEGRAVDRVQEVDGQRLDPQPA